MDKNSYYNRLVKINSVIVLMVVILITGLFYAGVWNTLKIENRTKQEAYLNQIRDYVDTKLVTSYNLLKGFRINENIIAFVNNEEIDNYNILQIHQTLSEASTIFTDLGYSMSITKPGYERIITPEKTTNIRSYFIDAGDAIQPYDFTDLDYLTLDKDEYVVFTSLLDVDTIGKNERAITLLTKEKTIGNESFVVMLSFYENHIFPELNEDVTEAFAIVRDNQVLGTHGNIDKNIITDIVNQMDQSGPTSNESYQTLSVQSEFMDWEILSIEPVMPLKHKLNNWLIICCISAILLSVVGYYFAVKLSKFNYRPVGETIRLLSKYNNDQTSSGNELDYVYRSIEQLGTNNLSLKHELVENQVSLQVKYLRDQLLRTSKADINRHLFDFYATKFSANGLRAIVLEYLDYDALKKMFLDEGITKIRKEILQQLESTFSTNAHDILEVNYQQIVLLLEDCSIETIRTRLTGILTQIVIEDKPIMVATIGKKVDSFREIASSYELATEMMEFKMLSYQTPVIDETSPLYTNNVNYYYPIDLEKSLINDVLLVKKDEVINSLNNLLIMNFNKRQLDAQNLFSFTFSITNTIYRICRQSHMEADQLFDEGYNIFLELKLCHSTERFKEVLCDIFNKLMTELESSRSQEHIDVVRRMMGYIEENYYRDLSLDDVADRFNLSKGYISGIFKEQSGSTFLDYLNRHRIKKAKEILASHPDIKIKDLAEKVGCNTSNTFIRLFKKYEKISPGAYQKSFFL